MKQYVIFNMRSGKFINKFFDFKKSNKWHWDNKRYYVFNENIIKSFMKINDIIPPFPSYYVELYYNILLLNKDNILIVPMTEINNIPIFTKAFKL